MMERISIQEIAAVLIEKNGLRKKEAEQFALTMFELIKESLATDRVVKVKGLGTFKVVDIEARESVNVNTGERVLIEGHDKVTFTPDNTMKELVNKPFSQFETVVLNEGVTFEDIEEGPETPEAQETSEIEPERLKVQVVMETPEPEPKSEPEPELEPEPEPEPESEPEPEPEPELLAFTDELKPVEEEQPSEDTVVEEQHSEETTPEEETTEEPFEEELYMSKKMTYIALVIAIVACILSFAAGYYYRGNMPQTADVAAVVADSLPAVATDTLANDSLAADNVKNDTTVVEQTKEDAVAETTETVKEETKTESAKEVSAQPEAATDKYEQMDVRVRTGAYRILGEDHEVKVKAGETLAKLARRTLGADMECYIEVFNGLKPNTSLTEGQTIKIPKLELKKKKKANN